LQENVHFTSIPEFQDTNSEVCQKVSSVTPDTNVILLQVELGTFPGYSTEVHFARFPK